MSKQTPANFWVKDLDPRQFSPEQRITIKINERIRQLEARISLLEDAKK